MKKRNILYFVGGLIILILISWGYYFYHDRAVCGQEFNNLYKKAANTNSPPNFCLQIKNTIKFNLNSKGYGSCAAFNGHEFGNSNRYSFVIPDVIPSGGFPEYQDQLISSCIESYSIYTKTDYCDMIPLNDSPDFHVNRSADRFYCIESLAKYMNEASLCEKLPRPDAFLPVSDGSKNPWPVYFVNRYSCYGGVAEKNQDTAICKMIPEDFRLPSQEGGQTSHNLRQECIEKASLKLR